MFGPCACRCEHRRMGLHNHGCRHEHGGADDDGDARRHADAAGCLGYCWQCADVCHVVGNDDRHDVALGSADAFAFPACIEPSGSWSGIYQHSGFCDGVSADLGLFSALATVLHAFGEATGFINGMMVSASIYLSAALLIIAGIWQLAPQKYKCLDACRNPVEFLSLIWRPGRLGALRAGLLHGAFCVGCCWAMMLLLFVGGVMNLYWIGGLALFVLAEKTLPLWHVTGRISGVAAIIGGVVVLVIA